MTFVPLGHYLALGAVLFVVGLAGVLTRRSALVTLMSIEIMLNAVNLTVVAFARYKGLTEGHALAFFNIAVAAAEAAVGLALTLAVFRLHKAVDIDDLRILRR